jgi:transcriptional regulator with XRE-family HTH domain
MDRSARARLALAEQTQRIEELRSLLAAAVTNLDANGAEIENDSIAAKVKQYRSALEIAERRAEHERRVLSGEILVNGSGQTLGEALQIARMGSRKRLSQTEAGQAVGKSRIAVSNWERDNFVPDPSTYIKLCRLYERTPEEVGFIVDGDKIAVAPEDLSRFEPNVTREFRDGRVLRLLVVSPLAGSEGEQYELDPDGDDLLIEPELGLEQARYVPVPQSLFRNAGPLAAIEVSDVSNPHLPPYKRIIVFRFDDQPERGAIVLCLLGKVGESRLLVTPRIFTFMEGQPALLPLPGARDQSRLQFGAARVIGVACGIVNAMDEASLDVAFSGRALTVRHLR